MNTKHISLAFAAAAVAALLSGCTKNPMGESGVIEEPDNTFTLADLELSHVGATETKAAIDGTTFPTDGQIGLSLFKDEAATTPYADGCTNVKYSYDANKEKWTASPSIKVGSETGYLYGYYPYSGTATNIKAIPIKSSLNGDDVMYATKQTVTSQTAAQATITMNHALARVCITVVNKGYTGNAKLSKIKFSGAETALEGTLNALDGSVTATKSDVTLDVTGDAQTITTAGTIYECLLVPSKAVESKQDVNLTLTIDGEDKTASLSDGNGVIIAQGTKSNITIGLSNSGISVQTVSVEDWNIVEVGGHTVTVKLSNDAADAGISGDVLSLLQVNGSDLSIDTYSKMGKPVVLRMNGTSLGPDTESGNLCTFTISDITSDITATLAYAKTRTVTFNMKVDKAPNVSGYVYGKAEPITVIECRPCILTATTGEGYAFDYFNVKGTKYGDKAEVFIPDDVETIDAYFRFTDWLGGVFSVGENTKVRFSRGNLWCDGTDTGYSAATPKIKSWGFESNQYSTPSNRAIDHISHFMWCKSASESVKLKYAEQGATGSDNLFTNASPTEPNENFAVNGQKGFWRALSGGANGEWKYLIERKDSEGNALYKLGVTVCDHSNCLILLPDDWEWDANTVGTGWQTEYSESTDVKWSTMEASGAVCLPAAGYRNGGGDTSVIGVGNSGNYWSSTRDGSSCAYHLNFYSDVVSPANINDRGKAYAVRLVTEYQSEPSAE